jgi:protein gp37
VSDKTGIEWTRSDDGTPGATWNPVTGCTKVSSGCDHCYAETFAERWRGTPGHHFENGFDVTLRPERLGQPLKWRRPRRIFVNSMSDLFHQDVPDEYIARVFAVMAMANQHTFLVLTKRHARMRAFLRDECRCGTGHAPGVHLRSAMDWAGTPHSPTYVPGVVGHEVYHRRPWPLRNVHLGTSIELDRYCRRADDLRETPAAVRFLSLEPLLGPLPSLDLTGIDWAIIGGESGPGAREMDLGWAHDLIARCREAGTAVFVKQLGSRWAQANGGHSKGGDWDLWPEDLKLREFPRVPELTGAA